MERRRDIRYPARIVARLARRRGPAEVLTNDVSFRGAFLRTDAPAALRQLLRVSFELPEGVVVETHGMVVRVVTPSETSEHGRVPGMGLQFWGSIHPARAWEAFVAELRNREANGVASARATDKVRRSSERFKMALDVSLDGEVTVTRDVSETGMAIRSSKALPVGTRATLQIRRAHESVVLDVVVRRAITEPGFVGFGVEFVDPGGDARRSIVDLVRASAPEEDVVLLDEGDPGLC